jgi:hypothetical protein
MHPVMECEHVSPFTGRQLQLILRKHVGHLLERKAQFVRIDELGDQQGSGLRSRIVLAADMGLAGRRKAPIAFFAFVRAGGLESRTLGLRDWCGATTTGAWLQSKL